MACGLAVAVNFCVASCIPLLLSRLAGCNVDDTCPAPQVLANLPDGPHAEVADQLPAALFPAHGTPTVGSHSLTELPPLLEGAGIAHRIGTQADTAQGSCAGCTPGSSHHSIHISALFCSLYVYSAAYPTLWPHDYKPSYGTIAHAGGSSTDDPACGHTTHRQLLAQ